MKRSLSIAAAAIAIPAALASHALAATSPGSLDTSFGNGGTATVALGSSFGATAVVVQPDGGIVTAGQATVGGRGEIVATRMTPSGALDPTFGNGGIATFAIGVNAGDDSGDALALQPDGKLVIVGWVDPTGTGRTEFAAVRLESNGSLDPTFGTGGVTTLPIGVTAIANAVAIEPDGDIVIGGCANTGHKAFAVAQLNPDGTLDTSFGTAGITTLSPTGCAWGIAVQTNGQIVVAGQANYTSASTQQFMTARLNTNGTVDSTFGTNGIVMTPVGSTALGYGVALQPNGQIVLAGPAFTTTGVAATVRLNPDGTLDQSYGTGGIGTLADWNGVNGIVLDAQGRIVLPTVGPGAVRMDANGTPDLTFGVGGNALVPLSGQGGANGAAIQQDGKIVLAGAASINGQIVLTVQRLNG
jgi:uncharacterized delta-60 repeat protein